MEYVVLNNGVKMPKLGFGVFQINDLEECEKSVLEAIKAGYRLIDTAQAYGNEEAVGNAINKSGVPREELFIVTKVWISNAGYDNAKESIERSLKKLQTNYIDLLLIHQPFNDYYGTYRAMEDAYKEGIVKAIGVSNFYPDRFIDLSQFVEIQPTINQVEVHVFHQQVEAKEIMKKYNTQIMAWGPFAQGKNNMFTNETLVSIGEKYNKSAAQVALRFLLQSDVVVIPKSVTPERIAANIDVFDFQLDENDMKAIQALDTKQSLYFSHYDPSNVERLTNLGKHKI